MFLLMALESTTPLTENQLIRLNAGKHLCRRGVQMLHFTNVLSDA
jgi:hypothetical protein